MNNVTRANEIARSQREQWEISTGEITYLEKKIKERMKKNITLEGLTQHLTEKFH